MTAALIWAPFADRESARVIARQMVEEKLVACANILGEMESVFVWRGEVDTASEIGVLFKTTTARCEDAVKRLGELHPYDTPAIMAWPCEQTHPATLSWLSQQLG